jgi:transposase-like protein
MNLELRQRWLDAAILLCKDVKAEVLCPKCQTSKLDVINVKDAKDSSVIACIFKCPSCGSFNEARIRRLAS